MLFGVLVLTKSIIIMRTKNTLFVTFTLALILGSTQLQAQRKSIYSNVGIKTLTNSKTSSLIKGSLAIKAGAGATFGNVTTNAKGTSASWLNLGANGTYTFNKSLATSGKHTFNYDRTVLGVVNKEQISFTVLDGQSLSNQPVTNPDMVMMKGTVANQIKTVALKVTQNDFAGNYSRQINQSSLAITQAAKHGTTTLGLNGTILYTPNPGYEGMDTVEYELSDNGIIPLKRTASIMINVESPIGPNFTFASDDFARGIQGSSVAGNVLLNDSDPENGVQKTTAQTTSISSVGTLTLDVSGNFSFVPTPTFTGSASFPYEVEDNLAATDSAILYVSVAPQSFAVLPVTLTNFVATRMGHDVELNWTTTEEFNSELFILQRSLDGKSFEDLGTVFASGTTLETNNYSMLDMNVSDLSSERIYYRLLQVDQNGQQSLSAIISISLGLNAADELSIYPNPTNGVFQIANLSNQERISIYNMNGQLVYKAVIEEGSQAIFSLEDSAPGLYNIVLNTGNDRQFLTIEKF